MKIMSKIFSPFGINEKLNQNLVLSIQGKVNTFETEWGNKSSLWYKPVVTQEYQSKMLLSECHQWMSFTLLSAENTVQGTRGLQRCLKKNPAYYNGVLSNELEFLAQKKKKKDWLFMSLMDPFT